MGTKPGFISAIDKIDTDLPTMFPLVHIVPHTATRVNGVIRFNLTISTLDIVDVNNDDLAKDSEKWKGDDNKQDIYNTMYAVLENFDKSLTQGAFSELGYELQGDITAEQTEDYLENLLVGWSTTITIDIPNTVQNCG